MKLSEAVYNWSIYRPVHPDGHNQYLALIRHVRRLCVANFQRVEGAICQSFEG